MRKLVLILFAVLSFTSNSSAQGIVWENCTLEQSLEIASKGKGGRDIVFLDCYTQTCPPCKMMLEKIFPTKQAGDYFNSRFVNIKLDLGAEQNRYIAEKYGVVSFPTFLIINPDGTEICRIVGASKDVSDFIHRIEYALDPANRVGVILDKFNTTKDSNYLFRYLERLKKESQYKRIREYVIENYDSLGDIVTDIKFWPYIKIAISLQDLTVLEKVLSDKDAFDKTIGKERVEKDLYRDLLYEVNVYQKKGGKYPPENVARANEIIRMFGNEELREKLILYNVNIVDTDSGEILKNRTIHIENGVIEKISVASGKPLAGEIDLSGKYVMPGMIDSHTHWGTFAFDSTSAAELSKEYLKCGVTTVRDLGSNYTNIKRYMDHLEAGHFQGPEVYYSSFWATGDYYLQEDDIKGWGGTKYDCPWSRMFSIKDSTDAAIEKAVLEAKEIGCTGFKLYINYSKKDLARVIPIIKKHGMKVWAHATQYSGAKSLDVAQSGVEVVSHSYMLSNDYTIRDTITPCELDSIRTVCKELIKNNVVLDITAHIAISAEMNFAIPITKEAYSQGVEFVIGTDYFGCAVPDEIKQLKKLGFGNLDILRAATSTGAKILGMAGKLGTIKEGAQADIIVLSGNPVEDLNVLNNIEATILDGKKKNY